MPEYHPDYPAAVLEFPSAPVLSRPPPRHSPLDIAPLAHQSTAHLSTPPNLPDRQSLPNPPPSKAPSKKPRAWSAIKRSASTLAAALSSDRPPPPKPAITTQSEFRRNFLKSHKDRIIRDNQGNCFKMHAVVMNGDCGFASIAKGVNIAREHIRQKASQSAPLDQRRRRRVRFWNRPHGNEPFKRPLSGKDIRKAMYDEIRKAKKTYLSDPDRFGGVFSTEDFDKLERDVSRPGIAGHWLGTVLGVLEHVIVAHAMNISIFLYQFDLQKQCIRQFESATVQNPDCEVYLFFTGPAACGHFDTLVKMSDPKDIFIA